MNTTTVLLLPVLVYAENLRRLLLNRCRMSFKIKAVIQITVLKCCFFIRYTKTVIQITVLDFEYFQRRLQTNRCRKFNLQRRFLRTDVVFFWYFTTLVYTTVQNRCKIPNLTVVKCHFSRGGPLLSRSLSLYFCSHMQDNMIV